MALDPIPFAIVAGWAVVSGGVIYAQAVANRPAAAAVPIRNSIVERAESARNEITRNRIDRLARVNVAPYRADRRDPEPRYIGDDPSEFFASGLALGILDSARDSASPSHSSACDVSHSVNSHNYDSATAYSTHCDTGSSGGSFD